MIERQRYTVIIKKALEKKLKSETERHETWRVVFISKESTCWQMR